MSDSGHTNERGSAQARARRDAFIALSWDRLVRELRPLDALPPWRRAELAWTYMEITAAIVAEGEPVPLEPRAAALRVGMDVRRWTAMAAALAGQDLQLLKQGVSGWMTATAAAELTRRRRSLNDTDSVPNLDDDADTSGTQDAKNPNVFNGPEKRGFPPPPPPPSGRVSDSSGGVGRAREADGPSQACVRALQARVGATEAARLLSKYATWQPRKPVKSHDARLRSWLESHHHVVLSELEVSEAKRTIGDHAARIVSSIDPRRR